MKWLSKNNIGFCMNILHVHNFTERQAYVARKNTCYQTGFIKKYRLLPWFGVKDINEIPET